MEINIITFFLFYFLIIFSTLGYGIFFIKKFSGKNEKFSIGFTGILGVFFLIILSISSHIFFNHGLLHNSVILLFGLFYFIKNIKIYSKKNLLIFILFFLVLFFATLIKKNHDDFSYYHFPYTYYIVEYPLMIGIGKFVHGFRTPSSMFYLNSIFYLPIVKYYMFNMGAVMIMGFANILIFERISNSFKKNKFDYLFILNLLIFSFINIFFYRLGEHGTDRSPQILILLFILELLYFINYKGIYKQFYPNFLVLLGLIISFKPFYILYLIFTLPIFILMKKYKQKDKIYEIFNLKNKFFILFCYLIFLTFSLYFVNTGCLVYPVSFTCFENFSWSIPIDQVKAMNNWYEQWSKAGAGPNFEVENRDIYIQNFNWVNNWIDKYFFNKVSDFILGLILLLSIFFVIFFTKSKKNKSVKSNFKNKYIGLVYLTIFLLFFEWFYNHPALRYGGYILVFLIFCIPFSIFLEKYLVSNNSEILKKKVLIIFILVLTIFLTRNTSRIIKENSIYEKLSLYSVNYLMDESYFRIDKQFKSLEKNYIECKNTGIKCESPIKKEFGLYIFPYK